MDILVQISICLFKIVWRIAVFLSSPAYIKNTLKDILKNCGITPNGDQPWDIVVKNEKLYKRVALDGSLGFGESYIEGWWDAEDLEGMFYRYFRATRNMLPNDNILLKLQFLINHQTPLKSIEVAEKHYNLGNDFFANVLDPTLNYSCAYWRKADSLDQAQLDKMDLIARKLALKPGMRVCDIGCGWGSLAKYLAEKHGVTVVGCNIAKEQVKFARESCKGLPVDIRLMDYRCLDEKFDRIVTVGFFEHVGPKNYRQFFEIVDRCLTDEGILLLHTIGIQHSHCSPQDPWMHKYIFPGGMLPFDVEILKASKDLFILDDWHNFGTDYHKTLICWHKNFVRNWDKIRDRYGEKFFRMWSYYLLACAGNFKARNLQLWQIVMSKETLSQDYQSQR